MNQRALAAELIGTFALVFVGCGTAMFSGPTAGIVAVSLAFGLTIVAAAYALGTPAGTSIQPLP